MRDWSIEIFLVHEQDGSLVPATVYEKARYNLHPSFERAVQTINRAPFRLQEEGWGEFDMKITMTAVGGAKGGEHVLDHDLNFQQEKYESTRKVVFKNPKGEVLERLRESGPVPGEDNGPKGAGAGGAKADAKKKRPTTKNVSDIVSLWSKVSAFADWSPLDRYGETRRWTSEAHRGRLASRCADDSRP